MKANSDISALEAAKSPDMIPCWSCQGPVQAGNPFCETCKAVQPPGQVDHFRRLGLEAAYDIDSDTLDRRYFEKQRLLHPDRFATKGPKEKALSQQQATSLNEAYETLKDPLARADYLLEVRGVETMPEGCHLVNDQELLMESMEMREALADAETPDAIQAVAQRAEDDINECVDALSAAFAAFDMEKACYLATRLKYLRKLGDETRQRRAQLAAAHMAI